MALDSGMENLKCTYESPAGPVDLDEEKMFEQPASPRQRGFLSKLIKSKAFTPSERKQTEEAMQGMDKETANQMIERALIRTRSKIRYAYGPKDLSELKGMEVGIVNIMSADTENMMFSHDVWPKNFAQVADFNLKVGDIIPIWDFELGPQKCVAMNFVIQEKRETPTKSTIDRILGSLAENVKQNKLEALIIPYFKFFDWKTIFEHFGKSDIPVKILRVA